VARVEVSARALAQVSSIRAAFEVLADHPLLGEAGYTDDQ
jgi:hypothetical protein